jgi:hypothetical protein
MSNPPFTAQVTIIIVQNSVSKSSTSPIISTDSTLSNAGVIAYNEAISTLNPPSLNLIPNVLYQASVSVKLTGTLILNGKSSTISSSGSQTQTGTLNKPYTISSQLTAALNAYTMAYASASDSLSHTEGIVQHSAYHS